MIFFRWTSILLFKWSRDATFQHWESAGLPQPPSPNCYLGGTTKAPLEGIFKILLAVFAIIISMCSPIVSPSVILIVSIYIMFIISGFADIFLFYWGYTVFPEGIQSFILSTCFAVEAICFFSLSSQTENTHIFLLIFVVAPCSLSSLMEVVFDN